MLDPAGSIFIYRRNDDEEAFLLLAACLLLRDVSPAAAYNPYAPNQFDGVDRNSWEYKAVYALSEAGLTGAPMERFDRSYNLTRYEVTSMIAVAMKNRSKATEAQQKSIDRLAKSYADDLQYLTDTPQKADDTPKGVAFDWKGANN